MDQGSSTLISGSRLAPPRHQEKNAAAAEQASDTAEHPQDKASARLEKAY